jgi:hypothetical protein
VAKNNDVTPKLRMVAKARIESVTSNEVIRGGCRVKSEIEQARRMLIEDSDNDNEDK